MVVLGHCAFIEIDTPFGGIYYRSLLEQANFDASVGIQPWVNFFSNFTYSFHMPAFIALSGALFIKGYSRGKWTSLSVLAKAKFDRILLPCIFVWFAYNVPLKYISGYYETSSIVDILLQFLFPNRVYLWYLECLFLCFIFTWAILRFSGRGIRSWLIIIVLWALGYFLYLWNGSYVLLGNPFRYCIWFWVGTYIDKIAEKLLQILGKKRWLYCAMFTVAWMLLYLFVTLKIHSHISIWRETVFPFVAIAVLWLDTICLEQSKIFGRKAGNFTNIASSYTYGVYLYAEPWNYVVLWAMTEIAGISILGTVEGTIIEFLLRSFGTIAIAILITYILKKTRLPIKAY